MFDIVDLFYDFGSQSSLVKVLGYSEHYCYQSHNTTNLYEACPDSVWVNSHYLNLAYV